MSALSRAVAVALVITMASSLVATGIVAFAEDVPTGYAPAEASASGGGVLHPGIDISTLTGEGGDPPELLAAASALAKEKEWYEYVLYSVEPVGTFKVGEITRISFYDPYNYSNSLIMEVKDDITDWSSANSLESTYEISDTLTIGLESSTTANSSVEVAKGSDLSGSMTEEESRSFSESRTDSYNESIRNEKEWEERHYSAEEHQWGENITNGSSGGGGIEIPIPIGGINLGLELTSEKSVIDYWTNIKSDEGVEIIGTGTTIDKGYSDSITEEQEKSTIETNAWSKVADRLTSATGSGRVDSNHWATSNSHSIKKVYNAQYFNEKGSPLQWKIVQYTVVMPMEYKLQHLIDDEWITEDSGYCLLNTIQGTCRAWIENNTPYYEHWGTGEPVVWADFWGRFFKKDTLIDAYKDKLYPDR